MSLNDADLLSTVKDHLDTASATVFDSLTPEERSDIAEEYRYVATWSGGRCMKPAELRGPEDLMRIARAKEKRVRRSQR